MSVDYFQIAANDARAAGKRVQPETHYLLAEHQNGRQRLSACNQWKREDEHSDTPDCAACAQYVADGARELSGEDMFGAFDPLTVVKHTPFDPTADYSERRR